jgi:uncharacterized protein Veg
MEHFEQAYPSLFVYQVQPADPRLTVPFTQSLPLTEKVMKALSLL